MRLHGWLHGTRNIAVVGGIPQSWKSIVCASDRNSAETWVSGEVGDVIGAAMKQCRHAVHRAVSSATLWAPQSVPGTHFILFFSTTDIR